jgi:hypothetical protein
VLVGPVVVGIDGGFEWVVAGGDECVVVGGGDECVVVGAGADAVVVGDACAVGVGADDVVVGAGAEDVVAGAADAVVVGALAAVVVGSDFGLVFFLWWTRCCFGGSCRLAFVVVAVLVAAAGVLVELLLELPELPQPATTATAMAEIKARFIRLDSSWIADVGAQSTNVLGGGELL